VHGGVQLGQNQVGEVFYGDGLEETGIEPALNQTIEMMVAILDYVAEHFARNTLFLSIETTFGLVTVAIISLLMVAAMVAMIRVITLMYLPRKPALT
jgi:hypothetical protein